MTCFNNKRRILILGGGYAGLMAAARAARGGSPAEITLVNANSHFVQRIRNHELLAGSRPGAFALAPALARRGVRFVQGFVEALAPKRQRVIGRDSAGTPLELSYDELIVALGSRTRAPAPGVTLHTVRLDDTAATWSASQQLARIARDGGRVLVVGGGLSGIETATELAERFPTLRINLTTTGTLGDGYVDGAVEHLKRRFARLGITVSEHTRIAGVEQGWARSADGATFPFALCIWCGGFETPELAREAGLEVDSYGRIVVDSMLRAREHGNIFAVGDAAAMTLGRKTIRMGCVSALPMGAHTGDNVRRLLRGEELKPFSLGIALRCVSLGRNDGLIQWTTLDDTPRDRVWTHRRAAITKELVCRGTFTVVSHESRFGVPLFRWPSAPGEIARGVLGVDQEMPV